jgi:hypothetical protein
MIVILYIRIGVLGFWGAIRKLNEYLQTVTYCWPCWRSSCCGRWPRQVLATVCYATCCSVEPTWLCQPRSPTLPPKSGCCEPPSACWRWPTVWVRKNCRRGCSLCLSQSCGWTSLEGRMLSPCVPVVHPPASHLQIELRRSPSRVRKSRSWRSMSSQLAAGRSGGNLMDHHVSVQGVSAACWLTAPRRDFKSGLASTPLVLVEWCCSRRANLDSKPNPSGWSLIRFDHADAKIGLHKVAHGKDRRICCKEGAKNCILDLPCRYWSLTSALAKDQFDCSMSESRSLLR